MFSPNNSSFFGNLPDFFHIFFILHFFLGRKKLIRASTGGTAIRNRKIFLHLSSPFVGCLVSNPKSYLLLWVNSWLQKWKNQFWTLGGGLTDGLWSLSHIHIPRCSIEIGLQVPYGPRSQTGNWVKDWVWCKKSSRQNSFVHTSANPPIRIHPSPWFLTTLPTPHNGRTGRISWVSTQTSTLE